MSRRIAVPMVAMCVVAVACQGGTDSATDVESRDPVVTTTSLPDAPPTTLPDASTDTATPSTIDDTVETTVVLAGAEPADSIEFSVETEEEVPYLRQYAFTLPDGDILLAVWRHGAATEYDSGVAGTLTIPGVSADTVTGIDVVHGFEQPLVAESADGGLVVDQLMVKDHPVFIRLDQPAM